MLRRVIYTSQATYPLDKRALLDLLHEARGFNHIDGITGLLIHDDGHFLQIVEGPQEEVTNLIARLSRDTRHKQFQIREDVLTETRLFPEWSMGFGELSDPALSFLPGMIGETDQHQRLCDLVSHLPFLAERMNLELDRNAT